jgi:hypothetical protein
MFYSRNVNPQEEAPLPSDRKRIAAVALIGIGLLGAGFWLGRASALNHEPGSAGDPLVSRSYVEQALVTLRNNLEALYVTRPQVEAVTANLATRTQLTLAVANLATKVQVEEATVFRILTVPAGYRVIGGAGAEIVLRGGQGTIVGSAAGGLLDVTDGRDAGDGEEVPPNHLLVVPRADGRGMVARTDLILMVKGQVTLQAPAQGS